MANETVRVFYVVDGIRHRLDPAPLISISPEIYYANDQIIGYTYMITLSGYAAGLTESKDLNFHGADSVSRAIHRVQNAFRENGGTLEVWTVESNSITIRAKGVLIKKIDFETSDNYLTNYAPYTVELEVNELDLGGCQGGIEGVACNQSEFDKLASNIHPYSDSLVDIKKFKIKSFNDSWSFDYEDVHNDPDSAYYSTVLNLSYDISATGKTYYNTSNSQIMPSWQQAKFFVQDRLYKQIFAGLSFIGQDEGENCNPENKISGMHELGSGSPDNNIFYKISALANSASGYYKIYNEMISCQASESKGSFSATYTCKLKRFNPSLEDPEYANSVIHTVSKSVNVTNDTKYNHTVSVEGTIQGLIPGSIVDGRMGQVPLSDESYKLKLPDSGQFFTSVFSPSTETMYHHALDFYNQNIGTESDLYDSMKNKLSITYLSLGLHPAVYPDDGFPTAANLTLNHDYAKGTVTYSVEYTSELAMGLSRGYTNISIVRNDPVSVVREFIIPGRANGPVIQDLKMYTSKTISISINGAHYNNKQCINDLSTDIGLCNFLNNGPYHNIESLSNIIHGNNQDWIRTKKDFNMNPIDGSFSINLEFTCAGHMNSEPSL